MKRSKTSKAWMREHVNDFYVKQAKGQGYRSRAAFKLIEIAEHDRIFKPGIVVVDLGAAPGGWSQVAAARVGAGGRVFAVDTLPMEEVPGVDFIQGDFRTDSVHAELEKALAGKPVDLVISDLAPNITGIGISDQARSIELAELAFQFAAHHLKPGGHLLVKLFQGQGFPEFMNLMRRCFAQVVSRKPEASRGRSSEIYLLGKGFVAAAEQAAS